jgi:hypothetical protein
MNSSKNKNPVQSTQVNNKTSKKRRNRRRKAADLNKAVGPPQPVYPLPTYSNTGMRQLTRMMKKRITPQGEAFLKCAFAPPDFAASSPTGVPDDFRGSSLLKKHRYVGNFTCGAASTDYYILSCPTVGGAAYWTATVPAGGLITQTTVFTPVYYSDTGSLFAGAAGMSDVFTKYRYVSNHIELIPTMNQMSWSGSIQSWKVPVTMELRPGGASTSNLYTVGGLQGLNSTNSNQYTGPTNLGIYTASYNAGNGFDFQVINDGITALPTTLLAGTDFGQLNGAVGGIDPNFESLVIKISGMGNNVSNNFVLKAWACIEYQVNPGNGLYEYQTISPKDEYAMELYKSIILQLPVGVSFLENEAFWNRVLGIIKTISGGLSFVPGPYGAIASGVNMVAGGIESLVL